MPLVESPELLALGAAFFAALGHVVAKRVVSLIPAPIFLALRWLSSLTLFSLIATVLGAWPGFQATPDLVYLVGGALIGPVLAWNLYARAIIRLDVSIAFPLSQVSSLGGLALAMVFLGEVPTVFAPLGAALIVIGVFLLYGRPGRPRPRQIDPLGVALALGTSVCWSTTYVLWKLSVVQFGVLESSWVRVGVPAIVMWAVVLVGSQRPGAKPLAKQVSGLAVVYSLLTGLIADVISFGLQFMALRVGQVGTVAPIINSSPLFLVVMSALILGERLSRSALAGVVVIVAGVWLVATLGKA